MSERKRGTHLLFSAAENGHSSVTPGNSKTVFQTKILDMNDSTFEGE